jgi:hypothetical protein
MIESQNDSKEVRGIGITNERSGMDQETFNKLFRKKKIEKKKYHPKPSIILPSNMRVIPIVIEPEEDLGPDPNFICYEYDDDDQVESQDETQRGAGGQVSSQLPSEGLFFSSTLSLDRFLTSCCSQFLNEKRMIEKPLNDWFNLSQNGLFIEFDSLLLFLFTLTCRHDTSSGSADRDFLICRKYQCSSLHLIFTLRRFLKRIVDHGVTVRLIYFLSLPFALKNLEYQFYRTLTILHLMTLSHPLIRLYTFESFECSAFHNFLQEGIPTELVSCEAIALDLNMKFTESYCDQLTDRERICVVHLPSISSPYQVSSIVEKKKNSSVEELLRHRVFSSDPPPPPPTNLRSQLTPWNPSQIVSLSFLTLCQQLSVLYDESESMTMKALICSHLLSLFVQSSLELSQRIVSVADLLIASEGKVNLSSLISSYFALFAKTLVEYWLDDSIMDLLIHSPLLMDRPLKDTPAVGIHLCDLWDGRLLCALHHYCTSFGHQTLFSALPGHHQAIISSHFYPARHFQWRKVELPLDGKTSPILTTESVTSVPLAQVRLLLLLSPSLHSPSVLCPPNRLPPQTHSNLLLSQMNEQVASPSPNSLNQSSTMDSSIQFLSIQSTTTIAIASSTPTPVSLRHKKVELNKLV